MTVQFLNTSLASSLFKHMLLCAMLLPYATVDGDPQSQPASPHLAMEPTPLRAPMGAHPMGAQGTPRVHRHPGGPAHALNHPRSTPSSPIAPGAQVVPFWTGQTAALGLSAAQAQAKAHVEALVRAFVPEGNPALCARPGGGGCGSDGSRSTVSPYQRWHSIPPPVRMLIFGLLSLFMVQIVWPSDSGRRKRKQGGRGGSRRSSRYEEIANDEDAVSTMESAACSSGMHSDGEDHRRRGGKSDACKAESGSTSSSAAPSNGKGHRRRGRGEATSGEAPQATPRRDQCEPEPPADDGAASVVDSNVTVPMNAAWLKIDIDLGSDSKPTFSTVEEGSEGLHDCLTSAYASTSALCRSSARPPSSSSSHGSGRKAAGSHGSATSQPNSQPNSLPNSLPPSAGGDPHSRDRSQTHSPAAAPRRAAAAAASSAPSGKQDLQPASTRGAARGAARGGQRALKLAGGSVVAGSVLAGSTVIGEGGLTNARVTSLCRLLEASEIQVSDGVTQMTWGQVG